MLQLREKGDKTPFEEILKEVNARDYQDTHREVTPLRQAEDAVLVDSSNLTFDETVQAILSLVEAKQ
jgi:cytidylate kinase